MHSSRMRSVRCSSHPGGGGCLPGGCTPPCGQTDICENITFLQLLLRTVINILLSCHIVNTRMHSSRTRTTRSSSCRRAGGGRLDLIPLNFPLGCGPGPDPPQFPPWVWPGPDPPQPLGVGLETP